MPVMELVPFSAHVAGATLTAFGQSLIFHDGIPAICAFMFRVGIIALAVIKLL